MTDKTLFCDTVIIGAGTAGIEAYKAASEAGAKCILIESGPLGTGAGRTGEIPISALLESGMVNRLRVNTERYGIRTAGEPAADIDNVLNVVRSVRGRATGPVLSFIYRIPEEQRIIGRASFKDQHTVTVNNNTEISFKTAVIATGSVPLLPFMFSQHVADGGIYTVNDFFDLDHLPNSMAVFGTGAEGLQIGQALSYLGVKVVIFGDHKLWRLTDESVVDAAADLFKERVDLVPDSEITAFERNDGLFEIYYMDGSGYENVLTVETILVTGSLFGCIDGLNIRNLGLTVTRFGEIASDPFTGQTSLAHIFAAGDVTSLNMTTAEAALSGRTAGINASRGELPPVCAPKKVALDMLFTDPDLAMVGLSYEEVKQRAREGRAFVAGEIRAVDGRFKTTMHEGGILRMYCDEASHRILGAEMCLHRAGHIAQFLSLAVSHGMTVEELYEESFFSLGYEDIIRQACGQLKRTLEHRMAGHRV